jgi:formate-dependent nitrite reductase membrane component NrfD
MNLALFGSGGVVNLNDMSIGLLMFLARVSAVSCLIVGLALWSGKTHYCDGCGLRVERPIVAIGTFIILIGIVLLSIGIKNEME